MILNQGNVQVVVAASRHSELMWLWKVLEFRKTGAASSLHDTTRRTFPAGLLPLVLEAAQKACRQVDVMDSRVAPCQRVDADLAWLRPYQRDAVEVSVTKKRGILWCPTASGKTEIAIGIMKCLPIRWLFLVHRGFLLQQAAERYNLRTGRTAGAVGEGAWNDCGEQLVVAMVDTLDEAPPAKLSAFLQSFRGVFLDEAHIGGSRRVYSILSQMPNAYWRLGMSGTPLARSDGRSLLTMAMLGPVIHRIRAEGLIANKSVAKPMVKFLHNPDTRGFTGEWSDVYNDAIVNSEPRNLAIVGATVGAVGPVLLFVRIVEHGEVLLRMFTQLGKRAILVHGKHTTAERLQAVRAAAAGLVDILVCTVIFQEGLDDSCFHSLVVAAGGKSHIAVIQRPGRVMRNGNGKDTCFVYDMADKGCGCGGRHRGCKYLEDHFRERLSAYLAEGYEVLE